MPSALKLGFPSVIPLVIKKKKAQMEAHSVSCWPFTLFLTQPLIANRFHFSPYRFASFGKYLPSASGGPGLLLPAEAMGGLGPPAWVSE